MSGNKIKFCLPAFSADIVDEKESEILQTNTTSVEVLIEKFERATDQDTESEESWSTKEIARSKKSTKKLVYQSICTQIIASLHYPSSISL